MPIILREFLSVHLRFNCKCPLGVQSSRVLLCKILEPIFWLNIVYFRWSDLASQPLHILTVNQCWLKSFERCLTVLTMTYIGKYFNYDLDFNPSTYRMQNFSYTYCIHVPSLVKIIQGMQAYCLYRLVDKRQQCRYLDKVM